MALIYRIPLIPIGPKITYHAIFDYDSLIKSSLSIRKNFKDVKEVRTSLFCNHSKETVTLDNIDNLLYSLITNGRYIDSKYIYVFVKDISNDLLKSLENKNIRSNDLQIKTDHYEFKVTVNSHSEINFCNYWYDQSCAEYVKIPSVLNHCVSKFLTDSITNKLIVDKTFKDDDLTIKVETRKRSNWYTIYPK